MSEKFKDAISILNGRRQWQTHHEGPPKHKSRRIAVEEVISFLELADLVDKKDAKACLTEGHVNAWPTIKDLLEGLPKKEEA
jgi:hypothetical protein